MVKPAKIWILVASLVFAAIIIGLVALIRPTESAPAHQFSVGSRVEHTMRGTRGTVIGVVSDPADGWVRHYRVQMDDDGCRYYILPQHLRQVEKAGGSMLAPALRQRSNKSENPDDESESQEWWAVAGLVMTARRDQRIDCSHIEDARPVVSMVVRRTETYAAV